MHPIIGLVGPSGAGKTTLILELLRRSPEKFGAVKTLVTREPRRTMDDPIFYDFTTREHILDAERHGTLIQISEYANNLYANDCKTVDKLLEEKIGLMAIVEMGVKNFRAAGYKVIVIRIIPEQTQLSKIGTPADEARIRDDAERAKQNLPADCTIVNSFEPGGKEQAVKELIEFIETIN